MKLFLSAVGLFLLLSSTAQKVDLILALKSAISKMVGRSNAAFDGHTKWFGSQSQMADRNWNRLFRIVNSKTFRFRLGAETDCVTESGGAAYAYAYGKSALSGDAVEVFICTKNFCN